MKNKHNCFYILFFILLLIGITGCATSRNLHSSKKIPADLDSCIVDKNYDFVFEIVNNTNETIFFTNGVNLNTSGLDTMRETKSFSVKNGDALQIKYDLSLIERLFSNEIENLKFFIFMTSENNTAMSGNPDRIYIYEKDGLYTNSRNFFSSNNPPQHILADRKYILTLSNDEKGIKVSSKIKDLSDFVYDDIVPGDGKSPVKLQLRNSKEYIEVDWQYPRYHENGGSTCGDWQICQTGKDIELILNYNINNDFYVISSTAFEWNASHNYKIREYYWDAVRDYTVEELEILIGVKPPQKSPDGVIFAK